jgi:hypothetical protein
MLPAQCLGSNQLGNTQSAKPDLVFPFGVVNFYIPHHPMMGYSHFDHDVYAIEKAIAMRVSLIR